MNLDKLLYPIMMQIRSLRPYFRESDDNNRIVLECQNKVESFVLCILHFILDLIVQGPNHTTITFDKNTCDLKKEFQNKLDCIQQHIQNSDPQSLRNQILQFYEAKEGFSDSESEDESVSLQIKLTGRIKEFNPEIQQLKAELEKKEQMLEQYRQKLKYRQNSLEIMAHNHHKEVSVLKVQQAFIPEDSELFEVKYFDQTQMLEPEVIAMMNEKIRDIKNQYEKYVRQYMDKFQKYRPAPVADSHIEDHTAFELLKAALKKEENPYQIFKIIQDIKSINFISTVLVDQQKKYGIDYDHLNQALRANNQDLKKLINTRILMEDCQAQISAQYLADLEKKKQEIFELTQQITQQQVEYSQQVSQLEQVIQNNDNPSKLNEVIISQQHKIEQLKNENYNINTMLLNQRQHCQQKTQQHQFLMNNLKHLFSIIYAKYKNNINIDRTDFLKDKSAVVKDILQKVNHLEGYEVYSLTQELQLLLFQTESANIVNKVVRGRQQNKQTQTLTSQIIQHSPEEQKKKTKIDQKIILHHLEQLKQDRINENKYKTTFTQTEQQDQQQTSNANLSQDFETVQPIENQHTNSASLNLIVLKPQQRTLPQMKQFQSRDMTPDQSFEKQYSVFEKLYTQQKTTNPRWKQLRPLIEKLSEEEFQEVVNTLNLYSFRQQQVTQNNSLDVPQYDISRIQQSQVYNTIKKKMREKSTEQTANIFIELDEQRESALKQFEQQRIDTYRRRIQKLLPVQPNQNLYVEEKLRPKSRVRYCSVQKT